MRVAMRVLVEKHKPHDVYTKTEYGNQKQVWANYLLWFVNSFDRLYEYVEGNKN